MSFPSSPVYANLFHRHANVQLKIVVVGASLSGLSAAYNLRQAGHDVRVLDRSNSELKFSAGVRVPPNLAKLLQHWGIGQKLREKAVTCPKIEFLDDVTGELLSTIVYHKELMKELQADVYNIPYGDLHGMIRDLAFRSGVKIDYNATVVDVDVNAPSLLLENGTRIDVDLIVAADGSHSIVRERLVGQKGDFEVKSPNAHYYLIPAGKLRQDPILRPLVEDGTWRMWTGDMRCILGYQAGQEHYAMCVITPKASTRPGWTETIPMSQVTYSNADECIKRLLSLGSQVIETQHIRQEPLESWYSGNGKIVLVGNSVHVSNPGSMNEAALSVEDGAVLGSLLSRLQTKNETEIVRLLAAYQEVRQDRCDAILQTDTELLIFCTLPPGPARDQRNAGFAATSQSHMLDWDNVDEDVLRSAWEEFRSSFGYEAYDAADDWWIDWGVMVKRIAAAGDSEISGENEFSSSGIRLSLFNGFQTQTVVTTAED